MARTQVVNTEKSAKVAPLPVHREQVGHAIDGKPELAPWIAGQPWNDERGKNREHNHDHDHLQQGEAALHPSATRAKTRRISRSMP